MSFDIYFQGFRGGDPVPGGGDRMRAVLKPYASRQEPPSNVWLVQIGDGTADVYLDDDHMMANRVSGQAPWELLVKGAPAAAWVIMRWDAAPASPKKVNSVSFRKNFRNLSLSLTLERASLL